VPSEFKNFYSQKNPSCLILFSQDSSLIDIKV